MTLTTELAGALAPAAGRPEAPTAHLLLPADAPESEWHAVRRAGIGGSDVAAILGLAGKYSSPRHVFEAKHGRDTFDGDTEYAEVGREIEDFIARLFSKRSGVPIAMPPGTLVHNEHAWMRANVDRYALDEDGGVVAPVECKNRSEYQIDDWEDGVPDAPALQAHWYMAVGGWDYAWVTALVGGNKLRFHRLERDEEMIGYLVDYCGNWFQKHVVEGFPPPPDGLEATTNLLAKLWSVKPDEVATVDLSKAKELLARRADLKVQEKTVAGALRTVENEMRLLTGKAEIAKADGKQAWSWKQNGNFAPAQFAKAHPELAGKYTKTVDALDIEGLKTDHPQIYTEFRARVLRPSTKGLDG